MSDLTNEFPSWGETGSFPADGFFYEGGNQVNEKHMDALWNGLDNQVAEFITGIENRVIDGVYGDYVTDNGLVASTGGGTREVDVTSTSLAYVDGQRVTSVSAQTVTLTDTGGSSRTDVVYLQTDGSVAKSEGTTSPPSGTMKIAEVDLDSGGSITTIRNYTHDRTRVFASETSPGTPSTNSGIWHDKDANQWYFYNDGDWRQVAIGGKSFTANAQLDLNDNSITDVSYLQFFDSDSDTVNWRLIEDGTSGHFQLDAVGGGGVQIDVEHNGDVRIEGELTEGASL